MFFSAGAAAIVLASCSLFQTTNGIEFSRRQVLTNGETADKKLELCWGSNSTHIEVQMAYPTMGWIAMGLSPNGGMDQSDVLFAYINDTTNEAVVQDRYLQANMETYKINLTLDAHQDWSLVSGSKNGTHTTIRAIRKITTCDNTADRPFVTSSQPVIYSYCDKLPASPTGPIRKHNFRGTVAVNFLQAEQSPDPDISGEVTRYLEFRMPNKTIPGDADTHYYCEMTKLPQFDKKYQSLANEPLINMQNMKLIHHMLIYVCGPLSVDENKMDFFECGPSSNSFVMSKCQNLIGGWAMGAKPVNYQPNDVGLPFTPEMSGMQVVLQIHYNNPERLTFVDDSGMKFWLTDKIRKYDSGAIMTGILSLDWTLTIPPGLTSFHVQGECSDQCTASMLPPDGVNIYASTVHMHTRGRKGVARHFRGDQEILPPLGNEMTYDFNFQHSVPLSPVRKFLPGDRVIVECNFTTVNDTSPIYGGEGSMEEMCLIFLNYYPKADLSMCGSIFKVQPYLDALGLNPAELMKEGKFPKMRDDIAKKMVGDETIGRKLLVKSLKGPVSNYITDQKWSDSSAKVNDLEKFYSTMSYLSVCRGAGKTNLIQNDRPPQVAFYADPTTQGC